jgi:D-aminoacyl-tRNA deacylase
MNPGTSVLLNTENGTLKTGFSPMRACIQRVSRAQVTVRRDPPAEAELCGRIGLGFLVLLGVAEGDSEADARQLAVKISGLRAFEDDAGKMNLALADVGGQMLVVSQFTLLGDCSHGRRPSFTAAARPEAAERLYEVFVAEVAAQGIPVVTGRFRAHMDVELVNDGPVTLLVESR